jgi:hypothetical protein
MVTKWMNTLVHSPINAKRDELLRTLDGLIAHSVQAYSKPHGWDNAWLHHLRPMCSKFATHTLSAPGCNEKAIATQIVEIYHAVDSVWLVIQEHREFRSAFQSALNEWFTNLIAGWGYQYVEPIMQRVRREYQIPTLAQLDTYFRYLLSPHNDAPYWTQWWGKTLRPLCENFIQQRRAKYPLMAETSRHSIMEHLSIEIDKRRNARDELNLQFLKTFEHYILEWIYRVSKQYNTGISREVASWRYRKPHQ